MITVRKLIDRNEEKGFLIRPTAAAAPNDNDGSIPVRFVSQQHPNV